MRGAPFHGASDGARHVPRAQRHRSPTFRCSGRTVRTRDAAGGAPHIRTSSHATRPKRDGFGVLRSATGCGAFGLPCPALYQKWLYYARKGPATRGASPNRNPHFRERRKSVFWTGVASAAIVSRCAGVKSATSDPCGRPQATRHWWWRLLNSASPSWSLGTMLSNKSFIRMLYPIQKVALGRLRRYLPYTHPPNPVKPPLSKTSSYG